MTHQKSHLKYKNVKTDVDGITFDSIKEANRWCELQLLERAKEISGLQRQVKFPIVVNDEKICDFILDFMYCHKSKRVVEDVKSPITAKNPVYRLKKKLLKALYGIEVQEV